jgi:hypothetical protein
MPVGAFEQTVPASERPHTHALHRVVTGIGLPSLYAFFCIMNCPYFILGILLY